MERPDSPSSPGSIVVVGAGQAGAWVASTLRDEGYDGRLVLLGDEPESPYERPPLSKDFLAGTRDAASCAVKPEGFYAERSIDLRLGCRVRAIDRARKAVVAADGETFAYDALVLATGARPRLLPVPGADLPGVCYLRTMADSAALRERLRPGLRICLIGGGYIGLEIAATATALGCQATVVEALPEVLARTMPAELSRVVVGRHRARGVTVETAFKTSEIVESGGALSVISQDGRAVAADLVVIGIGILPNVELAEAAGLDCDNGILVDAFGRSSDPAIYAAGDVTCHHNPLLGRSIRLESWQNAQNQGIAIARAILGNGAPYAEVPWFWSDQFDMNIQAVGAAETWDAVVMRGDPEGNSFAVFCLSEGVLVSAYAVNAPRDVRFARQMIAKGAQPCPEQLADPAVALKMLARAESSA
ncbi:NAD(P)/FAD-dependent oxidoreductase [Pelagibius sp.]|uniref:NAD(P)/FAD-dependent oxidoreductase n=1 Tax=Pelagibius sp. TaxID=1931238 RepID=UPI00262B993C|nr:FAD-dependent oxidoreductase [Pelagibius sp.]